MSFGELPEVNVLYKCTKIVYKNQYFSPRWVSEVLCKPTKPHNTLICSLQHPGSTTQLDALSSLIFKGFK